MAFVLHRAVGIIGQRYGCESEDEMVVRFVGRCCHALHGRKERCSREGMQAALSSIADGVAGAGEQLN